MDNKKPFVARLPQSAGQRLGFSRTKAHAVERTESLRRDGGGNGEEPNLHCMQRRKGVTAGMKIA